MEQKCIDCGKPKVVSLDRCRTCYQRYKYNTDEVFRKKTQERNRKSNFKRYYEIKKIKPEYNAKKQREFRQKNPNTHHRYQCKWHFDKLPKAIQQELLKEFKED